MPAHLGVDLEVGVEEAEGHPGRAAAQVVLGQADQADQLAAGGRPGVVEPQQHEDGTSVSRHTADTVPGLGRERPRARFAGPVGRDQVQPVGAALVGAGRRHVVR